MGFVKIWNGRFRMLMWSDSRIVNAAPNFCLCASCGKSNIREGITCLAHDRFMDMTHMLEIAAPVFACPDFVELEGAANYLDQYYDGEKLSTEKSKFKWYEYLDRVKREGQ